MRGDQGVILIGGQETRPEALHGVAASGDFVASGIPQNLDAARFDLTARQIRPAAFLDRDGVLNVDRGYVHRIGDLEWMATAPAAVRLLNHAGYYVFVVTNQAGIARGLYQEAAVNLLHAHMQDHLKLEGARIDAFYYCPHHPEGVVKEFALQCRCRKPEPGMLEQAARDWRIDRDRSFLIGDRDGDLAAAAAFNIRGIKFDAQECSLLELVSRQLAVGVI